jgi:hypothetical protein
LNFGVLHKLINLIGLFIFFLRLLGVNHRSHLGLFLRSRAVSLLILGGNFTLSFLSLLLLEVSFLHLSETHSFSLVLSSDRALLLDFFFV